jgi:hypothetical protein
MVRAPRRSRLTADRPLSMERGSLGRERDQASLDRQKCVVKCAAGQQCDAINTNRIPPVCGPARLCYKSGPPVRLAFRTTRFV